MTAPGAGIDLDEVAAEDPDRVVRCTECGTRRLRRFDTDGRGGVVETTALCPCRPRPSRIRFVRAATGEATETEGAKMPRARLTPDQRRRLRAFVHARIREDPSVSGAAVYRDAMEALGAELSQNGFYATYWPNAEERRAIANGGGATEPEPALDASSPVEKPEEVDVGDGRASDPEDSDESEAPVSESRCRCGVPIERHREVDECAGDPTYPECTAEEIARIKAPPEPTHALEGRRLWHHAGPDGEVRAVETEDGRIHLYADVEISRRTWAALAAEYFAQAVHG